MVVYNKYPADTRVRRAAESLEKAGYKVHVICTAEKERPAEERVHNVHVHRVGVTKDSGAHVSNFLAIGIFMVKAFTAVCHIHNKFHPAIYHIHSLPDFLVFIAIIPKLKGARIILDLHESFPEIVLSRFNRGALAISHLAAWLERFSCLLADQIIVVNDTIAKLVEKRGEKNERITVIMNTPMPYKQAGNENSLNPDVRSAASEEDPIFVYAGGMNAERDLLTLVSAIFLLKKKGIKLRTFFFTHTQTPFLITLQEQIVSMNLSDSIHFGGYLHAEDVLPNLRLSSIGIVSYKRNAITQIALPNKVFEYIEAGCPLVTADIKALRGLLGDAAHYYSPGDPSSLAEAIHSAMSDPRVHDRTTRAREIYNACAWPIMEKRLFALYKTVSM